MAGDDASNEFEVYFKEPTHSMYTLWWTYTYTQIIDYWCTMVHKLMNSDGHAELIVV